jgi:hypothetical protein
MRRLLYIALASLMLLAHSGCGSSDTLNFNSSNNSTQGNGLSGQTGTVTLQTQLAPVTQTLEDLNIIQSELIPASVNAMRFTGFDNAGLAIYGPVETDKATVINLNDVPVEVVLLRVELLVDGFTIGGLVAVVDVTTGEAYFLTNPTYIFLGSGVGFVGNVVYGSFISTGQGMLPQGNGGFEAAEAPIIDFPFAQVTNGVTRNENDLNYTVTQSGDYLLTYSVEVAGDLDDIVTTLIRNGQYVPNTDVDIADLDFTEDFPDATALQQFQHVVTLQAGDQFRLGVSFFFTEGEQMLPQQVEPELFELLQGTFTVLRLGDGGVTAPPPVQDV